MVGALVYQHLNRIFENRKKIQNTWHYSDYSVHKQSIVEKDYNVITFHYKTTGRDPLSKIKLPLFNTHG